MNIYELFYSSTRDVRTKLNVHCLCLYASSTDICLLYIYNCITRIQFCFVARNVTVEARQRERSRRQRKTALPKTSSHCVSYTLAGMCAYECISSLYCMGSIVLEATYIYGCGFPSVQSSDSALCRYGLFLSEKRQSVSGDASFQTISKKIGKMWSQLSSEEKQVRETFYVTPATPDCGCIVTIVEVLLLCMYCRAHLSSD